MVIKGNHLRPEDDCMRAVPNRGRCPASKRRIHCILRLSNIDAMEVISGHHSFETSHPLHPASAQHGAQRGGNQWSSVRRIHCILRLSNMAPNVEVISGHQ